MLTMLPLQCIMRLLVMLRHTAFIIHYSELYWHASSYVHLLKVVFGVKSACDITYTPSSPVSIKNKKTVNEKLTICLMDKTV